MPFFVNVIGTSAPKKPGRLRRRLPIHRRVDKCWKLRPHMSGWQNGQSITPSGHLIAYVDNLSGGSVPPTPSPRPIRSPTASRNSASLNGFARWN